MENECSLRLRNGYLCFPKFPEPCSYVRIVDNDGAEVAYWGADEFAQDAEDTLGALLGALCGRWEE